MSPAASASLSEPSSITPTFEALEGRIRRASAIDAELRRVRSDGRPEFELAEVLGLLARLALRWGGRVPDTGSQEMPGAVLGRTVADHLERHPRKRPAGAHAQLLRFNDLFFQRLVRESDLDPVGARVLVLYQPALAMTWLADAEALFSPGSPARQLLELLVRMGRGLDPYAGRWSLQVVEEMKRAALDSAAGRGERSAYLEASRTFAGFLNRYQRKVAVHEQRLRAREQGLAAIHNAQLAVASEIRRALAGRELPRAVPDFLQNVWGKYLHVIYLREGRESKAWKKAVQAMEELVWTVTPEDGRALQSAYSTRVNPLLDRLQAGVSVVQPGGGVYKTFLERLDRAHLAIMGGEALDPDELVRVPPEEPEEGASGAGSRPRGCSAETLGLRPRDWCKWHEGGRVLRCRVVENSLEHGYVLLANLSGILVARLDCARAQEALRSGALEPIQSASVFEPVAGRALKDWGAALESWQAEVEQLALVKASEDRERERRTEEAQEKERQAEARRAALVEARERQRREEEQAQAEARERAESERRAREQAVARAAEALRRMQPGGVVELVDAGQRRFTCRLALVLRSSGKMVFVDHLGRRTAEFQPDELAARIVEGSAQVVDYGVGFDETLQTLIQVRRESSREP